MDIALPAHRLGVPQPLGDHFDRRQDVPLGLGVRGERLEFPQELGGQHRARPRPEILRRQILPGDVLQVGVDLLRADGLPLTVLVEVLKELVPRQIPALLHDPCEAAIGEVDLVLHAALASK
jgi:hypothetical protein